MPIYYNNGHKYAVFCLEKWGIQMKIRFRLLALLMVVSLLACRICVVNVNAAEGVSASVDGVALTGLRITDLSKPVAGKMLDLTARVRTSQNVTWEIPVIWIDEDGNTATVAQPGKTYTPNFAFYVPSGYKISDTDPLGQFKIKLPDFLIALFGQDSAVFVADAGTGITYITFLPELVAARAAAASAATSVAPFTPAVSATQQTVQKDDTADEESSGSHSGGKSSEGSSSNPGDIDDPQEDIPEQVRIHCSPGAIETLGVGILEELVTLIKNKLEPQAVGLLKNSFPAYKNDESALGKQIGLFIYYESGVINPEEDGGYTTPSGALAFVSGGLSSVENGDPENFYSYVMGVDTKSFMKQDETGRWVYDENETDTFSNTVVHELMHAFMYDYTRRGMTGDNDTYPTWFKEGSASAVENVYQYRSQGFQILGEARNNDQYEFSGTLFRYVDKETGEPVRVSYTPGSISYAYINAKDKVYDLVESKDPDSDKSAYVSGYLAFVYLSYLSAIKTGCGDALTVPSDPKKVVTVSMDVIKNGASQILRMLHDGHSLDSVIKYISSDSEDKNPLYADTADFEARFIKGTEGDNGAETSVTRVVGGNDAVCGSSAFCSFYLNYLESVSDLSGDNSHLANGSILKEDQDYSSPLEWENWEKAGGDYPYQIGDSEGDGGFVVSTADFDRAWQTGGRAQDHLPDQAVAEITVGLTEGSDPSVVNFEDYTEGEQAAAKTAEGAAAEMGDTEDVPDNALSGSDGGSVNTAPSVPVVADPVPVPEVVTEPEVLTVPDAVPVPDVSGIVADIFVSDGELTGGSEELCILPTEQDALVPGDPCPEFEPPHDDGGTPSGGDDGGDDGGSDGGDDGGGDDGGSSDAE